MGLKKATVKLGADISQFQSKMKKASRSFKRMGASMQRVGKTMSMSLTLPLLAFAAASVKAFDVQAKAEAKLLTALNGNEAAFKSLTQQAKELQKVTLFGDEQTISAQSMLATMGLEEEAIKRLIPLIQDMATAKGMDLVAAADLVAKSVGSSTNALSRYGITIEGAVGSSQRLDSAVEALSNQFLGQSKAAAEAGAGGLTQLKNDFGDLMETIGEMLMPVLNRLIEKVKEGIKFIKGLSKAQVKNTMKWLALAAAIGPVLIIIGQLSIAIGVLTAHPIILILAGITALALKLKKDFTPAVNAAFIAENRLYKLRKKYGDELNSGKRHATGQLDVAFMVGSGKENVEAEIKKTASAIDILTKALGKYVNMPIAEVPMGGMKDGKALSNFKDFRRQLSAAKEDLIRLNSALKDINNLDADAAAAASIAAAADEVKKLAAPMALIPSYAEQWGVNFNEVFTQIEEQTRTLKDVIVDMMDQFANGFVNLFDKVTDSEGAIVKFGEKFKNFAKDFLIQIAKMIAQAAIFAGITSLFKLGSGAGFMSLFLGKLIGKEHGGPVAGNTPYLVGENGPELFMSQSAGTIIPNGQLGGAQTIIPDVRISGEDLIIVFDRANRHRKSLG